ncbi:acetolactate decarboxylase [Microbacterium sp. CFH 90308]|uniref:Alpha-acetolactate decarboxylase n=1 Tax=Microbacterium salsuginis TaxID=2722803 RepID=A0ABX1KD63_9MICO|nr:acetolactate decarboxylase [Microbacterium sp. CFH 90308]
MADRPIADAAVTQFAVLDALLAGAYDSGMSVKTAKEIGDFGIGCCESLGGEVIIDEGEVFECTVDEPPARMTDSEILPFVVVCRFPTVTAEPITGLALAGLTEHIERALVSRNLFHAVRVDGVVRSARVRVTRRQEHPFRPLAEVVNEQIETDLVDVRGTLIGFWAPAIYQGITVAGVHLHFLAEDRSVGGHILDVTIATASLQIASYSRFDLRLPTDSHFLSTELTHNDDHRIVAVEGGAAAGS